MQGRVAPLPAERERLHAFARSVFVEGAGPFFETANILYPRALLERLGGFDGDYGLAGDDTDLGWRAQELGAQVRFAPDALVWHAVHDVGWRGYVKDAPRFGDAVGIVKRHPGLRAHFHHHVFWKPSHERLLLALAGRALPARGAALPARPPRRAPVLAVARAVAAGSPRGRRRGARRLRARLVARSYAAAVSGSGQRRGALGILAATAALAVWLATQAGVEGPGALPELATTWAVAAAFFVLCGYGAARLLLPAELLPRLWLYAGPVGTATGTLALTLLGILGVPFDVALVVVGVAAVALAVVAVRRGPPVPRAV